MCRGRAPTSVRLSIPRLGGFTRQGANVSARAIAPRPTGEGRGAGGGPHRPAVPTRGRSGTQRPISRRGGAEANPGHQNPNEPLVRKELPEHIYLVFFNTFPISCQSHIRIRHSKQLLLLLLSAAHLAAQSTRPSARAAPAPARSLSVRTGCCYAPTDECVIYALLGCARG